MNDSAGQEIRRCVGPVALAAGLVALLLVVVVTGSQAAGPPDAEVRKAQEALITLGLDPGPADGLMGRRTEAALRAFQGQANLPVTGELDERTSGALERAASPPSRESTAAVEAPAPADTASPPAPSNRAADVSSSSPAPAVPQSAAGNTTPTAPAARAAPRESAPAKAALSYERLGWQPPAAGEAVLARHEDSANSPIRTRGKGTLIVPDASAVYVLARGERVDEFDCDPSQGVLHVDMAMGLDGPITFTSLDERGFCQMGFGILLVEGQEFQFEEAWWGDQRIRGGRMRVDSSGLSYVRGR